VDVLLASLLVLEAGRQRQAGIAHLEDRLPLVRWRLLAILVGRPGRSSRTANQ
jgi:hypothetical protein